MRASIVLTVCGALLAPAGGGAEAERDRRGELAESGARSRELAGSTGESQRDDQSRCDTDNPNHEVSEYDTSGDQVPDVRKVFLRIGEQPMVRLVLICREADLNADGVKDVVRYYNDEGRPLREENDRDFDGQMDEILFFEEGRVIRMEQDADGNGVVDTKIYYEDGTPVRAERDQAGRSSPNSWRPDTWEYYEEGRMVRMGVDLDGDGNVDRWDRDEEWDEQQERERAREAAEQARREAEEDAEGEAEDEGEGEEEDT